MSAPLFALTVKNTAEGFETEEREIFRGDEFECLGEFQKRCSFSFANHKQYSYTEFNIKEVTA